MGCAPTAFMMSPTGTGVREGLAVSMASKRSRPEYLTTVHVRGQPPRRGADRGSSNHCDGAS